MKEQGQSIQEAIKETGKAYLPGGDDFATEHDGELMWCRTAGDAMGILACVGWKDIARTDWFPYPNKKEIRPEREGEVWENRHGNLFSIGEDGKGLFIVCLSEFRAIKDTDMGVVHDCNGWKLIYSPDKEVMKELEGEKVVIEEINDLKEENSMFKKALSEIASLPGVRQDECCTIALGALDTKE